MRGSEITGDSFRLGYRFQRHWDVSMASAFFCGELGAGLYIVAMVFQSLPGLILGLLITGLGKSIFHLTHMGVPKKSWRAILRPDRSWVSRGLIAIVVFCGAGGLYTIDLAMGRLLPQKVSVLLALLACLSGFVVMIYQGMAMANSAAIALWNTAMMPVAGLLYGLTSGVIITLIMQSHRLAPEAARYLIILGIAALISDLLMIVSTLHAAFHCSPGGQVSVELLTRSQYARWFYGVTIGIGIILPLIALCIGGASLLSYLIAAGGALAGFYSFRILVFKAGVYEPILRFQVA
jgi:formate-dependent nitrite reductase membrane component NrfD